MKLKTLICLTLILLTLVSFGCKSSNPVFVLSTIYFGDVNNGSLYPEMAMDVDGNWYEASQKDIWKGQVFQILNDKGDYISKTKKLAKRSLPTPIITETEVDVSSYLGVYKAKQQFEIKLKEEIKGLKNVPKEVDKLLSQISDVEIKQKLESIVNADKENILDNLPRKIQLILYEYMIGDVNGDQKDDFVLLLAEGNFKMPDGQGAVIVIYCQDEGQYSRVILDFWEETNSSYGWPYLGFMNDFNGDKREEIFVFHTDADEDTIIIYSWFDNGVAKVFSKYGLWNGI